MTPTQQAKLWYVQRISAMVLVICVFVHLITILLAMQGGLSAAEILARTRGSVLAAVFYLVFVIAAAVHAPIGLMRIAQEWLGWQSNALWLWMRLFGLLLLIGDDVGAVLGLGNADTHGCHRHHRRRVLQP